MRVPEHCTADAGMFFDGHPAELALYEALFRRMDGAFPEGTVKVQKSQISFYGRHLFAAASLPVRRRKLLREVCMQCSFIRKCSTPKRANRCCTILYMAFAAAKVTGRWILLWIPPSKR